MRTIFASVFLCVVNCWWEVGHMMTAQIAKNYLKDKRPEVLAWADSLV